MTRIKLDTDPPCACAKTGSIPFANQASPALYSFELCSPSILIPPSNKTRIPGPACVCVKAHPEGGKETVSHRIKEASG